MRGRGAAGKKNVTIMAESTPLENENTKTNSRHCSYFKAKVLESNSKDEIIILSSIQFMKKVSCSQIKYCPTFYSWLCGVACHRQIREKDNRRNSKMGWHGSKQCKKNIFR